jgi:hypothetical protein
LTGGAEPGVLRGGDPRAAISLSSGSNAARVSRLNGPSRPAAADHDQWREHAILKALGFTSSQLLLR